MTKTGKKTIIWVIGILGLLILLFFVFPESGLYPVVLTSKWIITSRQFNKIVASSLFYYQKTFPIYATSTPINENGFQKEIKRAVLDKLIEDKVTDEILIKKLGRKELKRLVAEKITNLAISNEVAKASQVLYNLSLEDFKKLVLIPQAKTEIAKEQGINLEEIRKSYQPIILIPDFYWQNEVLTRD